MRDFPFPGQPSAIQHPTPRLTPALLTGTPTGLFPGHGAMDTHCGAHIGHRNHPISRHTRAPRGSAPAAVPGQCGASPARRCPRPYPAGSPPEGSVATWLAGGRARTDRAPPAPAHGERPADVSAAPPAHWPARRGGTGRGRGGARSPSAPGAAMMAGRERGRAGKRESGDGSCGTSSSRRTSSSSEHHHHPQNIIILRTSSRRTSSLMTPALCR